MRYLILPVLVVVIFHISSFPVFQQNEPEGEGVEGVEGVRVVEGVEEMVVQAEARKGLEAPFRTEEEITYL